MENITWEAINVLFVERSRRYFLLFECKENVLILLQFTSKGKKRLKIHSEKRAENRI